MYLDTLDVEVDSRRRIEEYLDLIRRRTDGAPPLLPAFIFVRRAADECWLVTVPRWFRRLAPDGGELDKGVCPVAPGVQVRLCGVAGGEL